MMEQRNQMLRELRLNKKESMGVVSERRRTTNDIDDTNKTIVCDGAVIYLFKNKRKVLFMTLPIKKENQSMVVVVVVVQIESNNNNKMNKTKKCWMKAKNKKMKTQRKFADDKPRFSPLALECNEKT